MAPAFLTAAPNSGVWGASAYPKRLAKRTFQLDLVLMRVIEEYVASGILVMPSPSDIAKSLQIIFNSAVPNWSVKYRFNVDTNLRDRMIADLREGFAWYITLMTPGIDAATKTVAEQRTRNLLNANGVFQRAARDYFKLGRFEDPYSIS